MTAAICYSGGLDSYLMARYAHRHRIAAVLVHVDIGHPQSGRERDAAARHGAELGMPLVPLDARFMGLPLYRGMDSHIVPGRNLTLAVLAAHFGDEVWQGAVAGERHPFGNRDKSPEFYHSTSAALAYSWQPMRPDTPLVAPLGHLTKAQAVAEGMAHGVTAADLAGTVTCYEDADPCGSCIACVHRWIAMTLNRVTERHRADPADSPRLTAELAATAKAAEAGDFTHYDRQRITETWTAWCRHSRERPPTAVRALTA